MESNKISLIANLLSILSQLVFGCARAHKKSKKKEELECERECERVEKLEEPEIHVETQDTA